MMLAAAAQSLPDLGILANSARLLHTPTPTTTPHNAQVASPAPTEAATPAAPHAAR
jgi:hypothetical protein